MSDPLIRIGTPVSVNAQSASDPVTVSYDLVSGPNRSMLVFITGRTNAPEPDFTVTFGGATLTPVSQPNWDTGFKFFTGIFQLREDNIIGDGVNDVSVSWTGGATVHLKVTVDAVKNAKIIVPQSQYLTDGTVTTIASTLDAGANTWVYRTVQAKFGSPTSFTHNNSQNEIEDSAIGTAAVSSATTSTIYASEETSDFTSTQSGSAVRMFTLQVVTVGSVFVNFATVVSATATVTPLIDVPMILSTIISVSSGSTIALQRDRGYVASLAVVSTVTPMLGRVTGLQSVTNIASTVTVQPIMRSAGMRAIIISEVTTSGMFNATRPLASVINAQLDVSASFANTFNENISSLTPGCYVELFEIDTTVIGGGDIFRFIPGGYDVSEVQWQGNEYLRFPIVVNGFEWNATSTAPPQPELALSNVNKFVLAAVITLGDLVGAKVTRWRTYAQYLDDGDQADANAHFPPDIYYVQQKTGHTKELITWVLSSALDLPGVRLPKRQVLRDQTTGNVYAPGVSQVRFKGR